MKKKELKLRQIASLAFIMSMGFTTVFPTSVNNVYAAEEPTFIPQRDSNGKPIFDGNPAHMTPFIDYIMDNDLSDDDLILMSNTRQPYRADHEKYPKGDDSDTRGGDDFLTVKAGYKIPLFIDGEDNVQGVYTEFPTMMSVGNSWNKELSGRIGEIVGDEKRGKLGNTDVYRASMIWTAIADTRTNPLSGRVAEGFSEDPFFNGEFSSKWASGTSGVNLSDEDASNDFYLKAGMQTKHFTNYQAEWFRLEGQNYISSRGLHEYSLPAFYKQIETGSIEGAMTSYGRTNGIPNGISPTLKLAEGVSPFSTMWVTDFNAPVNMVAGFGNGYDTSYLPDNEHQGALYAKAHSSIGTIMYNGSPGYPTKSQTVAGVKSGLFNVNIEDIRASVRPNLELLVRMGYFNAQDQNGYSIGYPFNDLIKNPVNESAKDSQAVAMDAAHESIVLLKNDGALPLQKNTKAAVMGPFYSDINKNLYAAKTPSLPEAGLTGLQAIQNVLGADQVVADPGLRIVALQSAENGSYLSLDADGKLVSGATAATVSDSVYKYQLSDDTFVSANEAFEVYDVGQMNYAFKSLANGKYLTKSGDVLQASGSKPTTTNDPVFRYNTVTSGTYASVTDIVYKNIRSWEISQWAGFGLGSGFELAKYTGKYLKAGTSTGAPSISDTVSTFENSSDKTPYTFKEQVIQQPGQNATAYAKTTDYGIIFVGAPVGLHSDEGQDRLSLDMGDDMYLLVSNAAAAYAAQGKDTIVVIDVLFPVGMDKIQNDPNVKGILFAPYAGQYGGKALADVLYGSYAPTGRLTNTWYKDISSFPQLNEYSLPEGSNYSLDEIDPYITVDYSNIDPIESQMTYMYTDADITYPFGYGLSYSEFNYSNLELPSSVSADNSFDVKVNVTNTGAVDTSEVVQLYAANNTSHYGSAAPKKKLVAFDKVYIPSGETRTVTLKVEPSVLAVWDVNRQEKVVELGEYNFEVGDSSSDTKLSRNVSVAGTALAELKPESPVNVWDHSFAANNLVYREVSKERTTNYAGGYYAVMSASNDSWAAIPNVSLNAADKIKLRVASTNIESTIQVREGSPTGKTIATLSFAATSPTTYQVPSNDGSGAVLRELGYKEVEADLYAVSGVHDLYLVFDKKDIRVDSLQLAYDTSSGGPGTPNPGAPSPSTPSGSSSAANTGTSLTGNVLSVNKQQDGSYWVDSGMLKGALAQAQNGVVEIKLNPADSSTGRFDLKLEGSGVEEANKQGITLRITTATGAFKLPGGAIANEAISGAEAVTLSFEAKYDFLSQTQQLQSISADRAFAATGYSVELKASATKDGTMTAIQTFAKPVTISRTFTAEQLATFDTDYAGIYYASGNQLQYIRSEITDSELVFTTSQSTVHQLLEYRKQFADMMGSWANEYVQKLAAKHIITGVNDTSYAPSRSVTRADFATMVVRALGYDSPQTSSGFSDIVPEAYYAGFVAQAAELGLVQGDGGRFRPLDSISREEAVTILVRAIEAQGVSALTTGSNPFRDLNQASSWSKEAIMKGRSLGLINGKNGNNFDPQGQMTRAELAKVVYQFINTEM